VNATRPSPKFPAILVFGDSTVDTGNNNYLKTVAKGNHFPYGKDFPGKVPTGRFSNGKLVPDFIASLLKIKEAVPPFLDPSLSNNDLVTGIELFKKYIVRVEGILGEKEADKLINRALVIISAGTNDFGFNIYDIPTRRLEFNITGYQDFLQKKLQMFIKELYELGCRKIVITGLPPIGCLPIQITAKSGNPKNRICVDNENSDAQIYNQKLVKLLPKIQSLFPGSKIVYADVYEPLTDMINNPQKFERLLWYRACGSRPLCNALTPLCANDLEYLFWDSIHPSEAAYHYISKYLEKEVLPKLAYDHQSQQLISLSDLTDDRY
ncbi:GDSL-like Lipase/Acylhydrolase family protein, partial [Prunus dulcis]